MNLPTRAGTGTDRPLPSVRWDPFREIEDAWTRMGSLLSDVVGGERRPHGVLAGLAPAVDLEETDDAFLVEVDLPNVRPEDLSVELRNNELFVTGQLREREHTGRMRRQSRPLGQFEHQIALPGDVDPHAVSASLDNGVLTVRLAKARSGQPQRIEISGPTTTSPKPAADQQASADQQATAAPTTNTAESSDTGAPSAQTSGAGSSSGDQSAGGTRSEL